MQETSSQTHSHAPQRRGRRGIESRRLEQVLQRWRRTRERFAKFDLVGAQAKPTRWNVAHYQRVRSSSRREASKEALLGRQRCAQVGSALGRLAAGENMANLANAGFQSVERGEARLLRRSAGKQGSARERAISSATAARLMSNELERRPGKTRARKKKLL